jgi:hypothetical protein
MTRRWLLLVVVTLGATPAPPLVTGLDHMPLAVGDLGRATVDFKALGFVLKPGRPHGDGIRNAHIKFPDHTEIELITAKAPADALAAEYAAFLAGGDGPAFWSLRAPDLAALTARLAALRLGPVERDGIVTFAQAAFAHRLFFADSPASPTDKPGYYEHPNTAYHLQAIWLAGAVEEARLAETFGARRTAARVCAPFARDAETLALPGGDVVITSAAAGRRPERAIIGATVLVRSLATARAILARNHVAARQVAGCGRPSLWIGPGDAHDMWLELREQR